MEPSRGAAHLGGDAAREHIERWESEWETYEIIDRDYVAVGDRVVVAVCFRVRGRGSGIELEECLHQVYTVRDSRIVRMDEFTDRSDALEVAGMSE